MEQNGDNFCVPNYYGIVSAGFARLFTALSVIDCHTIAHTPYPPTASEIPTMAAATSPNALDAATMRTSIFFISLLVCTIAEGQVFHPGSGSRYRDSAGTNPFRRGFRAGRCYFGIPHSHRSTRFLQANKSSHLQNNS